MYRDFAPDLPGRGYGRPGPKAVDQTCKLLEPGRGYNATDSQHARPTHDCEYFRRIWVYGSHDRIYSDTVSMGEIPKNEERMNMQVKGIRDTLDLDIQRSGNYAESGC
jgi:hypothetical protein